MVKYTKYNLILDPEDDEDKVLIDFMVSRHKNKVKNSYSTILKNALKIYKEIEEGKLKTIEK
jgi:hypothetical protein